MTTTKTESIDYLTLLGYVTELNIKVYSSNYIECNFTDSELLGSGNSMNVYHGYLLKDPSNSNGGHISVAIKVPRANVKDMNRDSKAFKVLADVRQELRMMKHFEAHSNIINLYGVFFQDLKPLTIVEIAEDCVTDYLAMKKEERAPLDWETKARFCCEVADGLQALHVAKIVHGDLKGDNILLFKDSEDKDKLVAKVTDFGYSATSASIEQGGATGGSLHFLAPECTKYAPVSMKEYENKPFKDKYAFGLFVWQVAKDGDIPYEGMDEDEIQKIKNTDKNLNELMNLLEDNTPQYFKDVIIAMTKYSPDEREDLTKIQVMMKLNTMIDASFAAAKINLELYAKEIPRDVAKADLSSIELMSIPTSLKTKIYRNYEKAAASDDANAMFMMAICHSKGFAVDIDKEKGLEWCIKAANAGSVNAMINLAENYDIINIPAKPEVAFPWYLRAAEEGYANSIIQVINCYANGVGIKQSFKEKGYWRKVLKTLPPTSEMNMNIGETSLYRAARLGNVEAMRLLLQQKNIDIYTDKEELTALRIAVQYGKTEVVKLFINTFGANIKNITYSGRTLLQIAALEGHVDVVRLLSDETIVTKLDLSSINLNNEEVRSLAESLKKFPALTRLNLGGNEIDSVGISVLMKYLNLNSALKQLDLEKIGIDEEGAYALGEYLEENLTLAQLNLQRNNIGNDEAYCLAEFLGQNSTLTQLNLAWNNIGDKGAGALAEYLEQNSSLSQLILENNKIGDNGAGTLAECLKKNTTLTVLNLGSNEISHQGASALAEYLEQNSSLAQLVLDYNYIRKAGAYALAECLKRNTTLTQLALKRNGIEVEGICALAECLKRNSILTHLNLGGNKIGVKGGSALAEGLKQNSALIQLDLLYSDIDKEGACALGECLKQNSILTQLSIENNNIGKEGAYALGECLKQNSTLKQLNLRDNNIGNEGTCALTECLKQNSVLSQLNIASNKIGSEGACALAEYLKQNSTLIHLNIGYNKIGKEGADALGESLKQNSTLTQLELEDNNIGTKGVGALAECLKQNLNLTYLNLGFNRIGDEGARILAECLKQNSVLTQLNVEANRIGNEGARALAEYLKQNSVLTQLNTGNNNIGNEGACALAECLRKNLTLTEFKIGYNKFSDEIKALLEENKIFVL